MSTHIPDPSALPPDAAQKLRDLAQVKNLLNGDTVTESDDTPVAKRLREFLANPFVSQHWADFSRRRPRL